MSGGLKALALGVLIAFGFAGCAPKESFSWIDRHCFVADWTNHYSCLSCCRNGPCGQAYPSVEYPMLVLGDEPAAESAAAPPVEHEDAGSELPRPVVPTGEQR